MRRVRVVLVLSVQHGKLVKTNRFRGPIYVGDPINTAKIFNDKMVDEVIVLDIGASRDGSAPDLELVTALAGECFMPLSYGGGIGSIEQISSLIRSGVEKVVLNTALLDKPELMSDAAKRFGSQSVVACIDVKKSLFGSYRARFRSGTKRSALFPVQLAQQAEQLGAGEIIIHSIDRDGTKQGFDLELIQSIATKVSVPVVALGGAGTIGDFYDAVENGQATAVAAGAMFVLTGTYNAVLPNYPDQELLHEELFQRL